VILRRLVEHLKQQHWTGIGIELVIVVVGVFLGMQVTNWNEDRETRQRSAVFTARLSDDLRKEAWNYEYLIVYNIEVNRHQQRVLDALSGKHPLADEPFLVSAYRASQYKFNNRYRAAYDELVSTGDMGLIADQRLRETAVSVFAGTLLDVISDEASHAEYRRLFRETVPAELQASLLARCGDRFAAVGDYAHIAGTIDYPCRLDEDPDQIAAAVAALKTAPRFAPALRIRFADTQTALTDPQTSNQVVRKNLQSLRENAP